MKERDRFLTLFDALVNANNKWMAGTPDDKIDWVPFDNENMKFGDRISTITIRSVYIHTIVGECGWSRKLGDCADGAILTPDKDEVRTLTEKLNVSRNLVEDSMKLHRKNIEQFGTYDENCLQKKITWSGRDWSVMGFLWGIYSHRSYHLGNIDILMREADLKAPDFFSSFPQTLA